MAAALVGVFGVAGALLRFAVDSWFADHASVRASRGLVARDSAARGSGLGGRLHWPWATLLVNVTGCFIIGAAHALTLSLGMAPEWQIALATGLAGGLTTFSSWTTATVRLFSEARFGAAAVNVAANLVLGFGAAAAGLALAS
ncbi:crcB-like family protein [Pseudarthrobacter siccitolerans]|uniref:Fluoride-specific ion channel FluC n=1 Tax=Pseudarthrobacter siccitolerans TaxID=861266 RepID=A0A024H141_9MICC|nr:CrcB family protein [Pseudarthrobacter siccitolerans]CCQ45587.1 crcB-like family protein [Pseudarthrobacter siccitolerans]